MNQGEQIMQDRFKFRTYDKRTKEMLNVRLISYFNTGNICRVEAENAVGDIIIFDDYKTSIEDIELMQCTGLKDKNGTLIYEGDVVYKKGSKNWKNEKLLSKVIWSNNSAAFMISDENGLHQMPMNSNNIEILGNIYETPELIGGE